MNQTYMKEKPILPLLLSMALPMVISMMVNSLYNIVDSYFVARISEEAMTALSLVYPIQNFITSVGVGFGIGINAAIAFFLGAQDQKKADTAATQGLFLSVIHGIVLTVVTIAVMPLFLQIFTKDVTVIQMGNAYSRIAFGFSIVISLEITWEKIFQAVGRMRVSMICMMSGCIFNIVLDPLLIFGIGPFPKMGIEGAALATGLGQVVTLVLYLAFYFTRPLPVKIHKSCHVDRAMAGRLYANPCHFEYGTSIPAYHRTEWDSLRLLPGLRGGARNLLQASDLPVSSGKWNHPGNASADRIQLRCR